MAIICPFEFHESISPVLEMLHLAIFQLQMAALQSSWVKRVGFLFFLVPLSDFSVGSRKQQS
jgi:hypothetical protein